jgi:broad specificity phosphatase PhoE
VEFCNQYHHLRNVQVIVSSHLRRCIQTSLNVLSVLIESGKAAETTRIIAHPDLQEVSIKLCDTGSPLDVLRQEFPTVDFLDDNFPTDYPRLAHIKPEKLRTIYDDKSELLAARAERFRRYLKEGLSETEILVVTHGSFAHFLFDQWAGEPGESGSISQQLHHGQVNFVTMPGPELAGHDLKVFRRWVGPGYPITFDFLDLSPRVCDHGTRDCGIFTPDKVRNAK